MKTIHHVVDIDAGTDTVWSAPVWHLLDLTPQGRDDWYAQLEYPSA